MVNSRATRAGASVGVLRLSFLIMRQARSRVTDNSFTATKLSCGRQTSGAAAQGRPAARRSATQTGRALPAA